MPAKLRRAKSFQIKYRMQNNAFWVSKYSNKIRVTILVRGSHMNMQMSILDILYFLKKHLLKWVPNELKCLFKPKKHSVKMKNFFIKLRKFLDFERKRVFLAFFQKSTYFKRLQNDLKWLVLCFMCILASQGVKRKRVFTSIASSAPVRCPQSSPQTPKWLNF